MDEPWAERSYPPDYGVDTASGSVLPWSWAVERLVANRSFWIVAVSPEGHPHTLPAWGVWDAGEGRSILFDHPLSLGRLQRGIVRRRYSSKSGTVNAVSPCAGLKIIPFEISCDRRGATDSTFTPSIAATSPER